MEAGLAEVSRERNELEAAHAHVKQSLSLMPWWGKTDDLILATVTLGEFSWPRRIRARRLKP